MFHFPLFSYTYQEETQGVNYNAVFVFCGLAPEYFVCIYASFVGARSGARRVGFEMFPFVPKENVYFLNYVVTIGCLMRVATFSYNRSTWFSSKKF